MGQDIRVGTPEGCKSEVKTKAADRTRYEVVAVEDGVISNVGSYTITLRADSGGAGRWRGGLSQRIVIGTRARYVSKKDALSHVAGYCVVNDVSEREYQLERGPQWDKGKGCDTFGPIGPWLVTRDEIANVQKLAMWLDVNGQRRQTGNTKTMIFNVAKLVSYVSQFMTLEPGDIITTGTPPGVGMGMKKDGKPAPVYLKKGDVMHLGIEGLGEQTQKVVAFKRKA